MDANCIIYSVERVAPYQALLQPLWDGARAGVWRICTSELSILETLVTPIRAGDLPLENDYRRLLTGSSDMRLVAITRAILDDGARLRAATRLRTPDAIHAATALREGCSLFVTNDAGLHHAPGLNVVVLRDLNGGP
ncbi:MAG: type II toxin-antitoxin system VapC family toxin [Ktedonobacterales bacterium]